MKAGGGKRTTDQRFEKENTLIVNLNRLLKNRGLNVPKTQEANI